MHEGKEERKKKKKERTATTTKSKFSLSIFSTVRRSHGALELYFTPYLRGTTVPLDTLGVKNFLS